MSKETQLRQVLECGLDSASGHTTDSGACARSVRTKSIALG